MAYAPSTPGFEDDEAQPARGSAYNSRALGKRRTGGEPETWPEPLDLFSEHFSVLASLDESCVPPTILTWARSEANRLGIDPTGLVAIALGICSVVITDDWEIRLKQNDAWTQQPRLWIAVVDRPGSKKSDQLKAARRPLTRIEAEYRKDYQTKLDAWSEQHKVWKALKKKEREQTPEPVKPSERRFTAKDITIESISDLLQLEATNKIGIVPDELMIFLNSFERYSAGRGAAGRAQAIELYDGGPQHIDRVLRGAIFVPNWSAAVIGAIQPERLRPIAKDLASDGLLQRFMTIVPGPVPLSDPEDDDRSSDKQALDEYETLIRKLLDLQPPQRDGGGYLQVWSGSEVQPHRRRLFRFIERVEADPTLPRPLQETVSKWRGQLARLALIYHCIEQAEGKGGPPAVLQPRCAEMAANFILRVVAPSTFRFYRELGLDGDPHARWIAGHILAHGMQRLSAYDIGRVYRELRDDTKAIASAMEVLEHAGWVRGDGDPRRPKWDVNPAVHNLFAEQAAAEKAQRERMRELIRKPLNALVY